MRCGRQISLFLHHWFARFGDGMTRQCVQKIDAHFPISEFRHLAGRLAAYLGAKNKKKQQNSANGQSIKSLNLTRDLFPVVQLYPKEMYETIKESTNEIDVSKTKHCLLPRALGRWLLL
jgi:hypothetical protein